MNDPTNDPKLNIEDEELIFDDEEESAKKVTITPMGIANSKDPLFKTEIRASQRLPHEGVMPNRPVSIRPILPRKKS